MLAERSKKRLFKDELEDTILPGKAITEPLSEVEYLGTSKIIKNVPSLRELKCDISDLWSTDWSS